MPKKPEEVSDLTLNYGHRAYKETKIFSAFGVVMTTACKGRYSDGIYFFRFLLQIEDVKPSPGK